MRINQSRVVRPQVTGGQNRGGPSGSPSPGASSSGNRKRPADAMGEIPNRRTERPAFQDPRRPIVHPPTPTRQPGLSQNPGFRANASPSANSPLSPPSPFSGTSGLESSRWGSRESSSEPIQTGFPHKPYPDHPDSNHLFRANAQHNPYQGNTEMPLPPGLLDRPSGRFVANEQNSIADAMFRRTYNDRVDALSQNPQKLADFESREHAQVFETRKNGDGMTVVYPTTNLFSGRKNALGINFPNEAFTPNAFNLTHSHFGPTRADHAPFFYDVNHVPSLGDQKGAFGMRNFGFGNTPPDPNRYETMFNPDQDKMVAFDGKFNQQGKLEHYEQLQRPDTKLPPAPWQPSHGMIVQSSGANPIYPSLMTDPSTLGFVHRPVPPQGTILNPGEASSGTAPPIHYGFIPRPDTPPGPGPAP